MSGASCRTGSWVERSSGRSFGYAIWVPNGGRSRRLLVIVHGFGEHGGRYRAVAESLAEQGVCVAVPDLWGHGRSGGARGDLVGIGECLHMLEAITHDVFLPASSQDRYVVFGHSFGGLAAILWSLNRSGSLRRIVVQSPLLGLGYRVPRWKTALAPLLARCWPTYAFSMNLDDSALSHDPAVVQRYRADPLVHGVMSARAYHAITEAQDEAMRRAKEINTPVLLLCGGEDRIVSVHAAERWFHELRCEKRYVSFPGCYHELHHETVREEVLGLIAGWTCDTLGADA